VIWGARPKNPLCQSRKERTVYCLGRCTGGVVLAVVVVGRARGDGNLQHRTAHAQMGVASRQCRRMQIGPWRFTSQKIGSIPLHLPAPETSKRALSVVLAAAVAATLAGSANDVPRQSSGPSRHLPRWISVASMVGGRPLIGGGFRPIST
jgi:hypothetical protein